MSSAHRRRTLQARFLGVALALAGRAGALYDPVHKLESARLYGNIDSYAYYFVDLIIGTPPQRVSVILDSGSGLAAFPCAGCPHCGIHIDPAFDFAKSSSAKWLSCEACGKSSCSKGKCIYRQSFLEGSSFSGFWFNDYVRLGDAIQRNPAVWAKVGCHQNENRLFYTQRANGIMGIQGADTLLQTVFADKTHVNSKVFTICLAREGGRFTVGGPNVSMHRGPIQYISQVGNGYGVKATSMRIDGQTFTSFSNREGGMIDSGTTYTYFTNHHYTALKNAIENACGHTGCGHQSGGCYIVPDHAHGGLEKKFPTVEVVFGSVVVKWKPGEYLYRKGGSSSFCYGFQNDGARSSQTFGASWMLDKDIIFDLENKRFGIAAAVCPEYSQRPQHRADKASAAAALSPPPLTVASEVSTTTVMAASPSSSGMVTTAASPSSSGMVTTASPTEETTAAPIATSSAPAAPLATPSAPAAPVATPSAPATAPANWAGLGSSSQRRMGLGLATTVAVAVLGVLTAGTVACRSRRWQKGAKALPQEDNERGVVAETVGTTDVGPLE